MDSNKSLVILDDDGTPRADSRIMAAQLNIKPLSFRELILNKQKDIEKHFGLIRFMTEKTTDDVRGRGRPAKYALLTEEQSYYVLTCCDNTDEAMELRACLIKDFMAMKQEIIRLKTQPTPAPAQLAFDFHFIVECKSIGDISRIEEALALFKRGHALLTGQSDEKGVHTVPPPVQPKQKRIAVQKNTEDEVLRVAKKLSEKGKTSTMRDLGRYLTRIEKERLKAAVSKCLQSHLLTEDVTPHATHYRPV